MTAFTLPTLRRALTARRRGAALLALVVLGAHAWLLVGEPDPAPPRAKAARESVRPLPVWRVGAGPAAVAPAARGAPEAAQPAPDAGAAGAMKAPGRPAPVAAAAPAPSPAPRPAPPPMAAGAANEPAREDAAAPPAVAAADPWEARSDAPGRAVDGGLAVPVYATRLPPAATLRYAWQRGASTGQAELHWQPAEGRYELTLSGSAFAAQRAWTSRGAIDAHGIAPERYAEARRGRELRAANFQRDAGRIVFSGPTHAFDWIPGAQDRLSWMLQLPAIVAADPALQAPGARVTMLVAGTGGTADAWEFVAVAHEAVDRPTGAQPALRWHRQAQRTWDTEVDVWLDPALHHLPVRARLRVPGSGAVSEWTLLDMTAP